MERVGLKAVGCVLLVMALAVGGFFALTVFVFSRSDDQSGLTAQVDLVVGDVEESSRPTTGRGWRFDYRYEYDGRWYTHESWIADDYWEPEVDPLVACVDPDDPTQHVIKVHAHHRCGQASIRSGTSTATPTSAPDTP